MELFDLTGKTAIVTGSSRGIGRAIAQRLAEHGARVAISSRSQADCDAVAGGLNASRQGSAIAVAANLASKDELLHLIDETEARLGPVDILVCNAAASPHMGPMATLTDDQFRKTFDRNVLANHWMIQRVAPGMKERQDGAIVIVSSIGGLKGSDVIGAYNVTKAADFQLARNLAWELGRDNIRVNCIAPGIVRTEFARPLWDSPEAERRALAMTPMRRIGEPDDIAGAAVFLASPAGRWVNGHALVVDGGTTA
jgi:NAD(P)-dependent dehydrogenase (short-subunit alcohol dehydrogenase family)